MDPASRSGLRSQILTLTAKASHPYHVPTGDLSKRFFACPRPETQSGKTVRKSQRHTQPTDPAKPLLTSTNNPTVKHLVKMRDNRSRRRAGGVIVDGWRETSQAMRSGLHPQGVYVCDSGDGSGSRSDLERQVIDQAGGALVRVSEAVMHKIAYGQSARGVVAEFGEPDWQIDSIEPAPGGCILVLDRIEKPGNIGAAFRCADAAGVDAVLLTPATADRFNPNAIRSSLGAVFTVPSAVVDESQARQWLTDNGFKLCAARVESSRPLWETDLSGPVAIIVGSEAHGLGDHWQSDQRSPIQSVRIPMSGGVDSLNASVSAAVLLYEAARQRDAGGR